MIAVLKRGTTEAQTQHLIEWLMMGSDGVKASIEYYASMGFGDYAYTYVAQQVQSQASSLTSTFTFGGTTLLIMIGVALETFRELEAQLTMRSYKGFLS